MARLVHNRDISPTLAAAEQWINTCLIEDGAIFSTRPLWSTPLVDAVYHAFVEHPDFGEADFVTKLTGQMRSASASAQQLMAEMLWALLLFPSNMKATTKCQQVTAIWALSGEQLNENNPLLHESVLSGIGSGGPGFNNYRPNELTFLISLTRHLKQKSVAERKLTFADYDAFVAWMATVPQEGFRQFRHMLRYFAFPDRVERMSSNNDRRKILQAFAVAPERITKKWSDAELDEALLKLRTKLKGDHPNETVDFYAPFLKPKWSPDKKVKTLGGEVTVVVPHDEEEEEIDVKQPEARQSFQIQARLAEIGIIMGFRVWVPKGDRGRIRELVGTDYQDGFLEDLPLNSDDATIATVEQIDVLWLRHSFIARAFEVEHTTAVYSGLLRMADLLALQPTWILNSTSWPQRNGVRRSFMKCYAPFSHF